MAPNLLQNPHFNQFLSVFCYNFYPTLMKFCLIFPRYHLLKNNSSFQILLIIYFIFVKWACKSSFERIFAFLTLVVRQCRCRKRVTDGVGEVLTTMKGSNMRHLVKVLLKLENLAQVKLQRKGFVITSIYCYGNKESFLCIEQFVFAMN